MGNCSTRLLDGKKAIYGLNRTKISVNKVSQVGDWVGGMGGTKPFPYCLPLSSKPWAQNEKTNDSLPYFFLNFWQALQIFTCHIFFWPATYSTSDIFVIEEIILRLDFQ